MEKCSVLFYATKNHSKLHNMHYRLREHSVQILSPEDLDYEIEVNENGATATDNAVIKALAYYSKVKMPTIAGDSGMYIEGLPQDKQPGLHVRRVNGKALSDEEMIEYYADIASNSPCDLYLHYYTGIALITSEGVFTTEIEDCPLKLVSTPNPNREHGGNPIDVLSLTEAGRYYNDLSDEERVQLDSKTEKEFLSFMEKYLDME